MAKERFRSKVNYYARRKAKATNTELYTRLNDIRVEFDSIVNVLKQSMKNKDSEYEALLMENEELIEAQTAETVSTFDSGRFKDSVRQCCIELLSLNVGICNVEPIIRTVMCNIGGIKVDRLPKYSTLVNMLSEMKVIAYAQLSEESADSQHTTLHSDGTTKFGHHYGSFQLSTDKSAYTH